MEQLYEEDCIIKYNILDFSFFFWSGDNYAHSKYLITKSDLLQFPLLSHLLKPSLLLFMHLLTHHINDRFVVLPVKQNNQRRKFNWKMFTYPILSWKRLRSKVRILLWTDINECPFLKESFPVLFLLITAMWVQHNAHPERS